MTTNNTLLHRAMSTSAKMGLSRHAATVAGPKTRGILNVAGIFLKSVAVFALVGFVYTACKRDGGEETVRMARRIQSFAPIAERRADWESVPMQCESMKENPVPFDKHCKRRAVAEEGDNFKCDDGRTTMFSQFRQDYYLYKYHFSKLTRPGNYLDIAANEPIGLSNTFFMDRCLGWSGICVEGNSRYFEKLYRLRSCRLLPTCVGEYDGQTVDFVLKGGSGGIESSNKGLEYWKSLNETIKTKKIRCTTMAKELRRSRVDVVDYLSLDVEGHELFVLKGIDWDAVKFNVMTIEVSKNSYKAIREFMEHKGYREILELPDGSTPRVVFGGDVLFVHGDVEFGNPE